MWEKKDAKFKPPETKQPETKSPETVSSFPAEAPPPPVTGSFGVAEKSEVVKIGRSIFIKGEISGSQDLVIEGKLEGRIELRENQVTVGQDGRISGEIHARHVVIHGQVSGNMFAREKLEIKSSGTLKGDISAPRLVIEDGAYFKGSVEMESKKQDVAQEKPLSSKMATSEKKVEDVVSKV